MIDKETDSIMEEIERCLSAANENGDEYVKLSTFEALFGFVKRLLADEKAVAVGHAAYDVAINSKMRMACDGCGFIPDADGDCECN